MLTLEMSGSPESFREGGREARLTLRLPGGPSRCGGSRVERRVRNDPRLLGRTDS